MLICQLTFKFDGTKAFWKERKFFCLTERLTEDAKTFERIERSGCLMQKPLTEPIKRVNLLGTNRSNLL